MPTISQFFGILIQMFWREHAPPHFMPCMVNTKPSLTFEHWNLSRAACQNAHRLWCSNGQHSIVLN